MIAYSNCLRVGEMLAPPLRIYLTGNVCLEAEGSVLDERQLPRRQGRLAMAVLALEHTRAISRDELAEALWPDELPVAWDGAVRALISKLRSALRRFNWPYAEPIEAAFGAYQLRLPPSNVDRHRSRPEQRASRGGTAGAPRHARGLQLGDRRQHDLATPVPDRKSTR